MDKTIDNWILNNLKNHDNSLIPKQLIDDFGLEELEKILTEQTGMDIKIRMSDLQEEDFDDLTGIKKSKKKNKKTSNKGKSRIVSYFAEKKSKMKEEIIMSNEKLLNEENDEELTDIEQDTQDTKEDEGESETWSREDIENWYLEAVRESDDLDFNLKDVDQETLMYWVTYAVSKYWDEIGGNLYDTLDEIVEVVNENVKEEIKKNKQPDNTLSALNNHLFALIDSLSNENLKGEKLNEELSRAKGIKEIAKTIVDNTKVQLEATKLYVGIADKDNAKELVPMIEFKKDDKE